MNRGNYCGKFIYLYVGNMIIRSDGGEKFFGRTEPTSLFLFCNKLLAAELTFLFCSREIRILFKNVVHACSALAAVFVGFEGGNINCNIKTRK